MRPAPALPWRMMFTRRVSEVAYMTLWLLQHKSECERAFAETYHRPPPWFEIVPLMELEDLAWKLGVRLGMSPPSLHIEKVCAAAWERFRCPSSEHGAFRGYTEPLGQAVRRLGVPTDGIVLFRRDGDSVCVRMRCRDLLQFEQLLWHDNTWVIDEKGLWILAGMHDWPVYWLDWRARSKG